MKSLRTVVIAAAVTAIAAAAALPTVNAGDNTSKQKMFAGVAPKPVCPPGDPNGCGIYNSK